MVALGVLSSRVRLLTSYTGATIKELGLPPPAYHRFQFKAHHLFGQENSPKEVDKVLVHGDGQNIAKCMANDYVVPPQASVPASSTPPSDNHQSV